MHETRMEDFATNLRLERVLPGSARDVPTCCSTSGLRLSLFGLRLSSETLLGCCSATFTEDWIRNADQLRPNPFQVDFSPAFWVNRLARSADSISEAFAYLLNLTPSPVQQFFRSDRFVTYMSGGLGDLEGLIVELSKKLLKNVLPEKYEYWADLAPRGGRAVFDLSLVVGIFFISPGRAIAKISQKTGLVAADEAAVQKGSFSQWFKDKLAAVNCPKKLSGWLERLLPAKTKSSGVDPFVRIRDMFQFADESTAEKLIPAAEAAGKAREAFNNFQTAKSVSEQSVIEDLALAWQQADEHANELAGKVKISKADSGTTEVQSMTKPGKRVQTALFEARRKKWKTKPVSIPKAAFSARAEGDLILQDVYDAVERIRGGETTDSEPLNTDHLMQQKKQSALTCSRSLLTTEQKALWRDTIDAARQARACEERFCNSPAALQKALASGTDGDVLNAIRHIGSKAKEFVEKTQKASELKKQLRETESQHVWDNLKKHSTKIWKIAERELTPGEVKELTEAASPYVEDVFALATQAKDWESVAFNLDAGSNLVPGWDPDEQTIIEYLQGSRFQSPDEVLELQGIVDTAANNIRTRSEARATCQAMAEAFKKDPRPDTFRDMMHQVEQMMAIEERIRGFQAQARSARRGSSLPQPPSNRWRQVPEDPAQVRNGNIHLHVSNLKALFRERAPQLKIPQFSRWGRLDSGKFVEEQLDKILHPERQLAESAKSAQRTAQKYPELDRDQLKEKLFELPKVWHTIKRIAQLTDRSATHWQKFLALSERVAVSKKEPSLVDLQRQVLQRSELQACLDTEEEITGLFKDIIDKGQAEGDANHLLQPDDFIRELTISRLSEVFGRMECEMPAVSQISQQIPESAQKRLTALAINSGSPTLEHRELIRRIARAKMKQIQVSRSQARADLLEMEPSEFGIPWSSKKGLDAEALAKNFYDDYYSPDWYKPTSLSKLRRQRYRREQMRSFFQPELQIKALVEKGNNDAAFIELVRTAQIDPEGFRREFFLDDWSSIMNDEPISERFFEDWIPDPERGGGDWTLDVVERLPNWIVSLLRQAGPEYKLFVTESTTFQEVLQEDHKWWQFLARRKKLKEQAVQLSKTWRPAAAYRNAIKSLIGEDAMELLQLVAGETQTQSAPSFVEIFKALPPAKTELPRQVAEALDDYYWSRQFRKALKWLAHAASSAHLLLEHAWTNTSQRASVPLPKIMAEPAEPLYQAVQALHEFQRMRRGYEGLIYCLRSERSASRNGCEMLAQMAHRLPETLDALDDAEVKASRAAVFAARLNSSYLDYLVAQAHGEYPSAISFEDGVTASVEDILMIDHWGKVYPNLTHNESDMLNDVDFEVNNGELLGITGDLCASNSTQLAVQNGSIFAAVCGRFSWPGAGGLLVNITPSRNETLVTYAPGSALSANDTKELLREIVGALVHKDSAQDD